MNPSRDHAPATNAATEKEPLPLKPQVARGYAILNNVGDWWSRRVFETEELAERHYNTFWDGIRNHPRADAHSVIPVTVTMTDARERSARHD